MAGFSVKPSGQPPDWSLWEAGPRRRAVSLTRPGSSSDTRLPRFSWPAPPPRSDPFSRRPICPSPRCRQSSCGRRGHPAWVTPRRDPRRRDAARRNRAIRNSAAGTVFGSGRRLARVRSPGPSGGARALWLDRRVEDLRWAPGRGDPPGCTGAGGPARRCRDTGKTGLERVAMGSVAERVVRESSLLGPGRPASILLRHSSADAARSNRASALEAPQDPPETGVTQRKADAVNAAKDRIQDGPHSAHGHRADRTGNRLESKESRAPRASLPGAPAAGSRDREPGPRAGAGGGEATGSWTRPRP